MASVNKVILVGHVGKEPIMSETNSGKTVTKFPLATSEKFKDKEKTTWHNIVIWGRQAEIAKEFVTKGRLLYIEGRIENRSYLDSEDEKRYITEIVAQKMQFLTSDRE